MQVMDLLSNCKETTKRTARFTKISGYTVYQVFEHGKDIVNYQCDIILPLTV